MSGCRQKKKERGAGGKGTEVAFEVMFHLPGFPGP